MAWSISMSTYQTTNEAANQSTVYATLTVSADSYSAYDGYATSWSMNIGGNAKSGGGPSRIWYGESWSVTSSHTFTHDANGYRGDVYSSVSFSGSGYAPSGGAGPQGVGAINYDRRPGTPSFGSITRSGNSISVYVNATTSPAGTATYYVDRSQNGSGYFDQKSGQSVTFAGLPLASTQVFRAYAANSDGTGGTVTSGTYSIPNVPSAPSSLNVSTSGTSITVNVGASSSNGGDSGSPTYKVRYSTNGGSTWSAFTAVSASVPYTYASMTPGLTYTFQAYASNSVGDSAPSTASTLLVVGGKRWNDTEWVTNTIARRWDGQNWKDLSIAKRWDGDEWVNLA